MAAAYCKAKLALIMCDTFMVCITYAAKANVQHKYDLTGCAHRRKPVVSTGLQHIRLSDKYDLPDCKRRLSGWLRLQDTSMI